MNLNLGCGNNRIEGYLNVDIQENNSVADEIIDLRIIPWKWKDGSAENIVMNHSLEHFKDFFGILMECHRVLRKNGRFCIKVPHITNQRAKGDLGHYFGASLKTFDDYLCRDYYVFKKPLFKTIKKRIIYAESIALLQFLSIPIQCLIDICPMFFERFWWAYVGGASEVLWIGEKL